MRKVLVTAWIATTLAGAGTAHAQAFGQFTGAEVLPVNGRMFGAYVHASENVVGLMSQLRLSFYPGMDFGFQGGMARQDFSGGDRTTIRLGADLKFNVHPPSDSLPFAIAAGANVGVETGDDFSLLSLGPSVVASRRFGVGGSSSVMPYVGLGLSFKRIDVGPTDDTDVSLPVRLGGEFQIAPQLRLLLELQLNLADSVNDNVSIVGGVNLPF